MDKSIQKILLKEHTMNSSFRIIPDDIKPRFQKELDTQKSRTKQKAEVFTPFNIVKNMNDDFDKDFSGDDLDYINRTVLEVTCGEAPFLTTRYDASTGEDIPVNSRTGLLGRKLKYVSNYAVSESGWCLFAEYSLKSTYGYEWQEDSIYIARTNLLLTTIEHFEEHFHKEPNPESIKEWAKIISYNIFKMDGVTLCIPETDIPAKIKNWKTNKLERFDGKTEELSLW